MSIKSSVRALAVIVAFLTSSQAPDAQGTVRKRLEAARSLSCVFPVFATGTWNNDGPRAELKTSKLSLRVEAIDTQDGTAQIVGILGPSYAVARLAEGTLHLMTIDNAGPLYVTTVFDKETPSGKLKAVHTRHEYTDVSLPGFTSRPEQYYGECEVGR
jgi:hypothetical protein